jgi:hypothetical protein
METTVEPPNVVPSKADLIDKLRALIEGKLSREVIASWANQWILLPDPPDMDAKVWEGLTNLSGADLKVAADTYLHNEEDMQSWLEAVEQ